jgi:hypothetical protein
VAVSPTQSTSLVDLSPENRKTYLDATLEREAKDLEPATNEQVGKMLAVVAGMIGCPIPPTPVLAKYIEMLTEYPADLIEDAGTFVLKRHKWNTFPKVAEFIEPLLEEYHERRTAYRLTQRLYFSFVGEHPPALTVARGPLRGQGPRRIGQALPEIKKEKPNG